MPETASMQDRATRSGMEPRPRSGDARPGDAPAARNAGNSTGSRQPHSCNHRLDEIDLRIVRELQASSKMTNAALAEKIGISPPSTLERVRRLESSGVITGYVALLNADALHKHITAIVHVSLISHTSSSLAKAKETLGQFDEVLNCWHTAGDEDFVLRVMVCDMAQYEQFISDRLSTVPGIGKIRTAFVLSTVKQTTQIPLDEKTLPGQEARSGRGARKRRAAKA